MGIFSAAMLLTMEQQVRLPSYDSGAPSPRIIPTIVLAGILISSICLIIQSLVLKKEKIYVFDMTQEKPAILLVLLMLVFVGLIQVIGFLLASFIVFPAMLFYLGERKPFIYIFTIAMGAGVYFLFRLVLNISLPGFGG